MSISIGEGLRMLQGGVDRTGFADMADSIGNPGLDLIEARRAAAAEAEAMEEYEKQQAERDAGFRSSLVDMFEGLGLIQPVPPEYQDNELGMDIRPPSGLTGPSTDVMNPELPTFREKYLPFLFSDDDFEIGSNTFSNGGLAEIEETIRDRYKKFGLGAALEEAYTLGVDAMPFLYDLMGVSGFEDGGRVEAFSGGIMNNLLGSPQIQNMLQQYRQPTMDFSQVASPSIPQPAVAPATPPQAYTPFVSTMPLYDPSTLGTGLPSTAGMADPFFVYDPYSPVGAFDAPPARTGPTPLTQDKIMETFKNLDKFTLAKQKAKADTAAKAKKQTRRGGGGSQEDRARNEARRAAMTERARDARNRGRGFSGRGTSDPGGQAAREA